MTKIILLTSFFALPVLAKQAECQIQKQVYETSQCEDCLEWSGRNEDKECVKSIMVECLVPLASTEVVKAEFDNEDSVFLGSGVKQVNYIFSQGNFGYTARIGTKNTNAYSSGYQPLKKGEKAMAQLVIGATPKLGEVYSATMTCEIK
ncbi:MAG TPA: hypothetical protein PLJ21_05410 [Pseudobdellovibrionaceae bacterium]|nr:hypothetical protein [Pseudobdellovibrionaceae bacterium]